MATRLNGLATLFVCSMVLMAGAPATAVEDGHSGHEGHGKQTGGGDHGGHDGGGKSMKKGKHGKGGHGGHEAGAVMPMCHEGMTYCEPSYKVASSVPGVQVSAVAPAGEQAVVVTLRELNANAPGVADRMVLVAAGGGLAGAVVNSQQWTGETRIEIPLTGRGSIYGGGQLHVHLFPLTGR